MKDDQGIRLVKNFFLMIFNTGFMTIISWLISIWIARKLGPERYGIFSFVLWLGSTFSWVIGMGLIQAVTRYTAEYEGLNKREYVVFLLRYVSKIEIWLSLITCVIVILARKYIADFFFSPSESLYITIMAIGILPGSLTAVLSASIEGLQKFKYITLAALIISPLSCIVKIVIILLNKGIGELLGATVFFSFVNFVFYIIALKKERLPISKIISPEEMKSIKKSLFSYNKNLFPVLLTDKIVWDKSENFFLGRFCQSMEIAYYNIGYNMAQRILSTLPDIFWRILFPAMSSMCGSGDNVKAFRLFSMSTKYLALVTFPIGISGIILAPELIFYLYGPEFKGAITVLRIIFFSFTIASISSPAASIL
ncbi:MAG: oligosaccharide flippase family protein, partial [Chitinispirillaceae bacterium]|nr:oligosaccharide flippase family protein [Chitinispirillaceae bacterium]